MMSKGVTYLDWSNKPQIICSIEDKSQSNYGEHCSCIIYGQMGEYILRPTICVTSIEIRDMFCSMDINEWTGFFFG